MNGRGRRPGSYSEGISYANAYTVVNSFSGKLVKLAQLAEM